MAKSTGKLAERLEKKMPGLSIIGPAPAPMAKLRGYYRWNILIKTKNIGKLVKDLKVALKGFRKGSGVFMAVDVDPMSM